MTGKNLRKRRRSLEISQEDVASAIGLSQSTINRMELGRRVIKQGEAEKIKAFFKVYQSGKI